MSRWLVSLLASGIMLLACGSPAAIGTVTPGVTPSTVASASPASDARQSSPSPVSSPLPDSPIPTASQLVTYANKAGQFTFSAPAAWDIQSCEDNGGYAVAGHSGLPPCGRGEYYDAWFIAEAPAGDQRQQLPPTGGNSFYAGTLTSTTKVTVDGVTGSRYTALVDQDLPLPPPKGTTQIYYVFFDGTRTYALVFDHFPADPDRSADFDRLVQETLRFSA